MNCRGPTEALRWVPNYRGSESIIEFVCVIKPLVTCLTYKIEKLDGEQEVLDTGGAYQRNDNSQVNKQNRMRYKRMCENMKIRISSVTVTRRVGHDGDCMQDKLGNSIVQESQVRALGWRSKTKSLKDDSSYLGTKRSKREEIEKKEEPKRFWVFGYLYERRK